MMGGDKVEGLTSAQGIFMAFGTQKQGWKLILVVFWCTGNRL